MLNACTAGVGVLWKGNNLWPFAFEDFFSVLNVFFWKTIVASCMSCLLLSPLLSVITVTTTCYSLCWAGIRSWNINPLSCDLNQQLRLFVTRHLAQFSSEVKGQVFFFTLSVLTFIFFNVYLLFHI